MELRRGETSVLIHRGPKECGTTRGEEGMLSYGVQGNGTGLRGGVGNVALSREWGNVAIRRGGENEKLP